MALLTEGVCARPCFYKHCPPVEGLHQLRWWDSGETARKSPVPDLIVFFHQTGNLASSDQFDP